MKAISGILLIPLLLCVLLPTYDVQLVEASRTIYIQADGSIDPPTAPISSVDNITYTFTDNINSEGDGVVVKRSNIIIDGKGKSVQGTVASEIAGIRLLSVNNVTIKGTNVRDYNSIYSYGIWLNGSSGNSIFGNTLTHNGYGIYLYNSSGNSINGNTMAKNGDGIRLDYSSGNSISGNTVTPGYFIGIELYSSSGNIISGNTITANNPYGIELYSSSDNSISENNIIANYYDGIVLYYLSSNNSISRNTITANNLSGIWVQSFGNSISGNVITGSRHGINLGSSGNSISGNTIANNQEGINLRYISGTSISGNNFIDNNLQAATTPGYANSWDRGYPSGGNYWSDHVDADHYVGLGQNQSGSDGVCDHSYVIGADNRDMYPLVSPLTVLKAGTWNGVTYNVCVVSNSTISGFTFTVDAKLISFKVTGLDGTGGFCRVTIPNALLGGPYVILVNDSPMSSLNEISNGTHTFLCFAYNHSTKTVQIIGTTVISGPIFIRADGSVDPPTALIQRNGDLYTITDSIYGSLVVQRDNIVIDGAGYTVQGAGSGTGIDLTYRVGATVKNTRITNFTDGIRVYFSSGITLSGNTIIRNSWRGIELYRSSNNTLFSNNITDNGGVGIVGMEYSSSNNISGNHITKNSGGISLYYDSVGNTLSTNNITSNSGVGIYLYYSSDNNLMGNVMNANEYNFGVRGYELRYFLHFVDISNLVNGKPIYYLVNRHEAEVPLDAGYVALVNCTRITVKNLTLKSNREGMLLAYTKDSLITGNNLTDNPWGGIVLYHSMNNTIARNNATGNRWAGVYLVGSSNNSISGNNLIYSDSGIHLVDSSGNNLSNNLVANHGCGLFLDTSAGNTIFLNTIRNNGGGFFLYSSWGNTVFGNNIENNGVGLDLYYYSSGNKVYHNNFVNNAQVSSYKSRNTWDDGYPSGGNYWSDYSGHDPDGDGIGDTPYVIDEDNQDRYPLMRPYGQVPGDLTPPTTVHDYDGSWRTSDFTITLTAADDMSGVAETYYKINDGSIKTVSVDGQPFITTEGVNNKLEYWSVDYAGNEESHHILTGIKLDKTASAIGAPLQVPDGAVSPEQEVKVSVSVADNISGVENVTLAYTVNDGATWKYLPMNYNFSTNLYETTIPQQQPGTLVKYKITACDNAGNQAARDNAGQYYIYTVVPEFPSFLILPLLMVLTVLAIVFSKRRMFRKIRCVI